MGYISNIIQLHAIFLCSLKMVRDQHRAGDYWLLFHRRQLSRSGEISEIGEFKVT